MEDYCVIAQATDPEVARCLFMTWLAENKSTQQLLLQREGRNSNDDVLVASVVGEGGVLKYQYLILRSLLI